MKIKIKTHLIEMEVEDAPTIGRDEYTKRTVDNLHTCLVSTMEEAIRLHQVVYLLLIKDKK